VEIRRNVLFAVKCHGASMRRREQPACSPITASVKEMTESGTNGRSRCPSLKQCGLLSLLRRGFVCLGRLFLRDFGDGLGLALLRFRWRFSFRLGRWRDVIQDALAGIAVHGLLAEHDVLIDL